MKIVVKAMIAMVGLLAISAANAEPSGGPFAVRNVRPYSGGLIYLQVVGASLCDTEVFTIDSASQNGKEIYAAVLTAIATGKTIVVEAAGCNGWGTRVQSIYLIN